MVVINNVSCFIKQQVYIHSLLLKKKITTNIITILRKLISILILCLERITPVQVVVQHIKLKLSYLDTNFYFGIYLLNKRK